MRNRITLLISGAAFMFISVVPAVTSGFAFSHSEAGIQDVLAELQELPFDEFVDASYQQILLRSPENVTSMGLAPSLGVGDDRLDNICYEYLEETYRLKAGIREILRGRDPSTLSYDQRISYEAYSWLLSGWESEHEYMYHFYPVTHGFSRQNDLFRFFEDDHPLETIKNVEDYISRLEQVDDQFACLIRNLGDSEDRGVMAPAQMLQRAADALRNITPGSAANLPFYTALATRIETIEDLGRARKQELLSAALREIEVSVIPAYQSLVAALDDQIPRAPPMNGVWQLPQGDGFYNSRLRHHTTTALSAAEIHQNGLDEVARIRAEIRAAFDFLGYPANQSFEQLFDRVAVESGVVRAEDIVPLNESFIRQAREDVMEVFDIAPQAEVIVRGAAGGGFYVSGTLDGSRPGAYYIGNQRDDYRYWMRTIAYHEAIPGHHFQIAIGNEQDVPLFSKDGGIFTAFVEGWALYAEYLAKELGWYDDDVYSELGRLQWELLRAARLVVDTGLHHFRWTRQEAIDYFIDNVGTTPSRAAQQIDLYLYWPGYFTAYKTGMLKILELRQRAMDELGELFDIKAFHRTVLLHNRLPLPLLERLVEDYIVATRLQAAPDINRGHAGAWFNPETPGQGQLIDIEPEDRFIFMAWFTFSGAASMHPFDQHWYTAQGNYAGNSADLVLYETLGGRFNDSKEVFTEPVGNIAIEFTDCGNGQLSYRFDGEGPEGSFPVLRAIPDSETVCEEYSRTTEPVVQAMPVNAGMDGAWFNESTPGQGLLLDVNPNPGGGNFIFVAWFTYGEGTASGLRWLTAQGGFEGSSAQIEVFETTGGSFDDPQTPATRSVGTMSIEFADCDNARLTYSLDDQTVEGSMDIKRAIPATAAHCLELTGMPE